MILRRITEHVKAQNWFAVALDFLIVVAGVVIGLQVSNWNDARKDRAGEARYIQQISADLVYDLDRVDYFIEFYASQAAAAERVIGYHESGDEIDAGLYYADVIEVLYFEEHVPRYSSLDALLGSGDVELLRDNRIFPQLLAINLRYEEVAKLQSHKYDDVRGYLYATYGDTLDYAKGIEAWRGTPPADLNAEVIAQARDDLRVKNGLTVVAFNNALLIESLGSIRQLILEAQALAQRNAP